MAYQLRALTAFPEVLSSIPSNHMVAPNHHKRSDALSDVSEDSYSVCVCVCKFFLKIQARNCGSHLIPQHWEVETGGLP